MRASGCCGWQPHPSLLAPRKLLLGGSGASSVLVVDTGFEPVRNAKPDTASDLAF